jgi:hypothetical protein
MDNDTGKPTASVATPPKDAIFTRGCHGKEAGKPTSRVAMSIVVTPPKDTIFGADSLSDSNGH